MLWETTLGSLFRHPSPHHPPEADTIINVTKSLGLTIVILRLYSLYYSLQILGPYPFHKCSPRDSISLLMLILAWNYYYIF